MARSDSYARWVGGLRGMLSWAGFPGIFGESSARVVLTVDDEEWSTFLRAVYRSIGSGAFAAADIVKRLEGHEWALQGDAKRLDPVDLPGELANDWSKVGSKTSGFTRRLGYWMRNRKGRFAGGWTLRDAEEHERDKHKNVAQYVVVPSADGLAG